MLLPPLPNSRLMVITFFILSHIPSRKDRGVLRSFIVSQKEAFVKFYVITVFCSPSKIIYCLFIYKPFVSNTTKQAPKLRFFPDFVENIFMVALVA
jgi:hypothetical protein